MFRICPWVGCLGEIAIRLLNQFTLNRFNKLFSAEGVNLMGVAGRVWVSDVYANWYFIYYTEKGCNVLSHSTYSQ